MLVGHRHRVMGNRKSSGFTLVELLVVITIIGILISLLLPAVQSARSAARRLQNSNNLKQLGLALQMYHHNHGMYPPARTGHDSHALSWSFGLLPYVEQQAMYDLHDFSKPVEHADNADSMRTTIPVFVNPEHGRRRSDRPFDNNGQSSSFPREGAAGDYAANTGWHPSYGTNEFKATQSGPFLHPASVGGKVVGQCVNDAQVRDGLSNTLALGDRWIPKPGTPMEAYDTNFYSDLAFFTGDHPALVSRTSFNGFPTGPDDHRPQIFGSPVGSQTAFVFLDGHVSYLSHSMSLDTYRRLSLAASGEPLSGGY